MADRGRRRTLAVRVALLAVAAFATFGSVASAHAVVDDIVPADGSVVPEAPDQVVISFSEPIVEEFVEVELVSSSDTAVGEPTAAIDPADASRLIVTLPPLAEETYQVRVSARDAADLHEVVARTSFSVGGEAPQPSPPVLAEPIPLETASRWLFVIGLAAVLGVFVFRARWPEVPMPRGRLVEPITVLGLLLIVAGRLGVIVSRGLDLHVGFGDAASALLETADVRRLPMVAIAVACIVPTAMHRPPIWLDLPLRDDHSLTVRQALGWMGAAWLVAMAAWGDHSALTGSVEVTTALAKALHLWGVALWMGVLGVAIALNAGRGTLRAALNAVSRTAVTAAVLAAASGLLLASRLVVSLTGLLTSPYGLFLVAKSVILVGAVAVGLRMRSGGERRGAATFEWAALATIALLGSAMATAGPAVEASFLPADDVAQSAEESVVAGDLLVQVQPIPGTVGPNTLQVRVHDTRRPSPAPFEQVVLTDADGVSRQAPIVDGNAFFDGVQLQPGSNPIGVVVERTNLSDVSADVAIDTIVPVYRHPVRISSTPIKSVTRAIGLVLLGFAAALWLTSRRRSDGIDHDNPIAGGEATWSADAHARN